VKSDSILFEFFHAHPHELLRLLRLERPGQWRYTSITLKQTERRVDGMLERQDTQDDPIFVEFQGYRDERIHWRVTQEICLWYLGQPWKKVRNRSFTGYVIFLDESFNPGDAPFKAQEPHRLVCTTLKAVLEGLEDPGPLVVLEPLILESPDELKERLPKYRAEVERLNLKPDALKLMEEQLICAILSRFTELSRKEVEGMITISPLRESLAVRECMDEAREEAQEASSRKYLLLFWESRFGAPVDWVRHRVEGCKDIAVLEGLMKDLARAGDVSQVEARVKAQLGNGI